MQLSMTFTQETWCYCRIMCFVIQNIAQIGYEPAGLTVHPPPERSRVGSFFLYGCLVPPTFFPQKKVDFVGDIKRQSL